MLMGDVSVLPGQNRVEKSDYDGALVYGFVYNIFI
jgi:hypothetical protein